MEVSVKIEPDENNLTGRECPQADCEGYFKIQGGTGLQGENLPCYCPYCGHQDDADNFYTKEQIEYAKSVALNQALQQISKEFKKLEFETKPKGPVGIGFSLKFSGNLQYPIRHYREQELETEIICDNCTLRYAVYGVFAFCPDCGSHNSRQILTKNLELVEKILELAEKADPAITEALFYNALEDCVSAFDGFGKEVCRVKARQLQAQIKDISFQKLEVARENIEKHFGFNIEKAIPQENWATLIILFQKRHLVAHSSGVIDQKYIEKTNDTSAKVGQKVKVSRSEIQSLIAILNNLASAICIAFGVATPKTSHVTQVASKETYTELSKEETEILAAISSDYYSNLIELTTAQTGSFLGNNTRKFIDESDPEFSRKLYLEAAEKLQKKGYLSLSYNRDNRKVYELTVKGIETARTLKSEGSV